VSYRGPNSSRISGQFVGVQSYAGATAIWRHYLSTTTGTGSAYWAGGGETRTYAERVITALWAAPQGNESRFREVQLPAGQMMAGDAVVSTLVTLGPLDELVWNGVAYRVEGDSTPTRIGGQVWYRTVLRRGDTTG